MKKLLLITFLIGIFVSCTTQLKKANEYWDAQTMFVVKSIRKEKGMKTFVVYTVEVVDANGFSYDYNNSSNNLSFEFSDTLNKYRVGQAIHFEKF
jgi:hypothetical protein